MRYKGFLDLFWGLDKLLIYPGEELEKVRELKKNLFPCPLHGFYLYSLEGNPLGNDTWRDYPHIDYKQL